MRFSLIACILAGGPGLSQAAGSLRRVDLAPEQTCGSMFVHVFSRRDAHHRRNNIRQMWQDAGEGWGSVESQFVFCQAPEGEKPEVAAALEEEQRRHGDVLVMDCEDGYLEGKLTKKVAASMKVFVEEHNDRMFYMKTDDDTFASLRRICGLLQWRANNGKDNSRLYMGVFAEAEESMETKHPPVRDPSNPWYESTENFPGDFYPKSAKGGPGYIISSALVKEIVGNDIAQDNILNNEDKAVGVWVDKLLQSGTVVDLINIPGTDGYDEHKKSIVTKGLYGKYPHFLHHHITGKSIACMHDIDKAKDPSLSIDKCFNQ